MKKIFFGFVIFVLFTSVSLAISFKDFDEEGVSLKAGPTDVVEGLSIAWVEAALYPKRVEKGQELFLEVKLTSKVEKVYAQLDFGNTSEKVELSSNDGFSWTGVSKTPPNIVEGGHLAQIIIQGKKEKQITRTLDFVVLAGDTTTAKASEFDITTLTEVSFVGDEGSIKKLGKGEKIAAFFKAPFYRVKLKDGTEGWVEASIVKEPTEEFYFRGYKFYSNREYDKAANSYSQAIRLDPSYTKAHYWLAKTYLKLGKDLLAKDQLIEVMKQDSNFTGARRLASLLVDNYYKAALDNLGNKNYKGALTNLNNVLALNPNMLSAWIKLGEVHAIVGSKDEAKVAWREALKIDPEDKNVRSLLGYNDSVAKIEKEPVRVASASKKLETKKDLTNNNNAVSKDFVKDSIKLVQVSKTTRGTSVVSAIKSVIALTKSLGTKVDEVGWNVSAMENGFLVQYACRQQRKGRVEAENFDWRIDPDSRRVIALNDNAKLLMTRW